MDGNIRRVLFAQAICAAVLAALLTALAGMSAAAAAVFGALLGMLATVATARSVLKSARAATQNPHFGLLPIFAGVALKLFIVAGGAFFGLVVLRLAPLYLVLGYLTVHAGYFFTRESRDDG